MDLDDAADPELQYALEQSKYEALVEAHKAKPPPKAGHQRAPLGVGRGARRRGAPGRRKKNWRERSHFRGELEIPTERYFDPLA